MKTEEKRAGAFRFPHDCAAAATVLIAAMAVASCTATSGPPLELASPAYSGSGVVAVMADVADAGPASAGETVAVSESESDASEAAADGDAVLPDEVAAVPAQSPAQSAPQPGQLAAADEPAEGEDDLAAQPQAPTETAPTDTAVAAAPPVPAEPSPAAPEKKRGFLASLFAPKAAQAARAQQPAAAPQETAAPAAVPPQVADAAATADASQRESAAQPQSGAAEQADVAAATTEIPQGEAENEAARPAAQSAESEPAEMQVASANAAPTEKKRGFLASFFASNPAPARKAPEVVKPLIVENVPQNQARKSKPLVQLASVEPVSARAGAIGEDGGLPGVRASALFEITRKSGMDDDSDVDLHEGGGEPVQMAYAAGLARLAPNGLRVQRPDVDVACLKPSLVRMLKVVERRFGQAVVVTSGYRSPSHNRRVRGARKSMHMYCAAADVQVPGVSKWELAKFVRAMPGRGGVGTYCHTNSVHIDVGPERDWNWRCRRRRG